MGGKIKRDTPNENLELFTESLQRHQIYYLKLDLRLTVAHVSCVTFEKSFNLSRLLHKILMATSKHFRAGSMRYCVEGNLGDGKY